MQNSNALIEIADILFVAAMNKCNNAKTKSDWLAAEPELDRALAEYRKVHKLNATFGLLDCVNHYNQRHA